jgi:DNA topoisomerase VI subunit B
MRALSSATHAPSASILPPLRPIFLKLTRSKSFCIRYARRSDEIPPPPREMKAHPSSLNPLLLSQLIHDTSTRSLEKFFSSDLAGITPAHSRRIIGLPIPLLPSCPDELGEQFSADMDVKALSQPQLHVIVDKFKKFAFEKPSGEVC